MKRMVVVAVGLVVAAIALTSCQEVQEIGVRNLCSEPFETRADTVSADNAPWLLVPVNEGIGVGAVSDSWSTLYVWLRAEGSAGPVQTLWLHRSQLTEPIDDSANYDYEVVVSGPECETLR